MTPCPTPLPARPAGAASLLLDATLAPLGAEPAALALIDAHPGLITLARGRLRLPQHQAALEAAAARLLADDPAPRGLALHRPGQAPLTLRLDRAGDSGPPRLWLHLVDSDALRLDPALLSELFDLTPTEQRVALLLAQGHSTEDIAGHLGVQGNTVRGHIKQLLAKTHTRRQAQFVARLWRSAAVAPSSPGEKLIPLPRPTQMGKDKAARKS